MVNFMKSVAARRLTFIVLLLSLGGLTAMTVPLPQEVDDEIRRLWNKQFQNKRAKAKNTAPATDVKPANQGAPSAPAGSRPRTTAPASTPRPSAPHNERPETPPSAPEAVTADELIGLTVWRLRPATAKDTRDLPRLLVQKKDNKSGEKTDELLAERISAETPIREGEIVRLGIEVPREGASYIYVIDREVYADGSMSDPYLIFPAKTTPRGDEVGGAGKITYVPSRNDPIPCFTLQRSRADQVSELLVIIVSPQPLGLSPGDEPLRLDPAQLAKWEREWGGVVERREARGSVGRVWTVEEKEAGENRRKLVQTDPLPHTIYWVKAGQGQVAMIKLPLRIAH